MEVRERLLQAALKVFQETGSRGATTRRIAAEAGVNEITLFRHFGSKGALITEALSEASRDRLEAGLPQEPEDPAGELQRFCAIHYGHMREGLPMIRACLGELDEYPEVRRCVSSNPKHVHYMVETYVRRLQARGMADPACDAAAASALLLGALFADAMGRVVMPERYPYPPQEAVERYVTLFLRAIAAAPAPADTEQVHTLS